MPRGDVARVPKIHFARVGRTSPRWVVSYLGFETSEPRILRYLKKIFQNPLTTRNRWGICNPYYRKQ